MTVMNDCKGGIWFVDAPEELIPELEGQCINWFNFTAIDFFWSDNGDRYGVDIEGDRVALYLA